ncbi:hypothetical protein [Maricaulis salignorans]|uniref:SpoIIAA-like n=1 Tax=Maricaulis salignorans TaxID=144026 RepID=A0A1G9LDD4_9PROT|nr:hypothetical protein [Maricaulis salignorans]SDL60029.1 hypothetical protein SAMN04488568_10117 [Maricaulis salignorans]
MAPKTCDILVDPAKQIALIDVFGAATIPCLMQAFGELGDHADWDPGFDIMILIGDAPGLESFTLATMEELQAFMRPWNQANRTGARPRTAFVCPDDLKRVIAELWAAMNSPDHWPVEIGVFVTRRQAASWLAQAPL